ncbi:MAG: hypothetical protein L3J71_03110 [Victivallaceae bacterium]|nr:hypothetical protein [Victivallaceae bacterium]
MFIFKNKKWIITVFIMLTNIACFSSKIYDYDYFRENNNEGMHYILKLEKFYDLIWNDKSLLQKYSLSQISNDINALEKYEFKKIEKNGFLANKLAIAKQKGLFKLFDSAFNAEKKHFYLEEPNIKNRKLFAVLFVLRNIYTYKILKNVELQKWDSVIDDFKKWFNLGKITQNHIFYKPGLITMFALLQKYNIPVSTLQKLIVINRDIMINLPKKSQENILDFCILNIIIAKLLIYEKEEARIPNTLSQLKNIKYLLKKQDKKILCQRSPKVYHLRSLQNVPPLSFFNLRLI